ncbi:MAG TPA: signal peptide peptidase SppA [Rhodanobacteraceae bacterium]|nr:signal peptide peptidase SppA [Rhodanobacteraceae bacterium]
MATSNGFVGFLKVIFRGLNLTRIVILNVVFFGLLAIFFIGAASHEALVVAPHSVLVLEPKGALVEQYSIDPAERALAGLSGQAPRQVQLRDLVRGIDAAAKDSRIDKLLLLPDQLQPQGYASLREVGAALDRFKAAGKPVVVWSAGMQQAQYYLAAHASKVLLDPQGSVLLLGIGSYRAYYKSLLDKLGVAVHLFRVGEYKSAAEPFILDQASDDAKQADAYWMGSLWDTLLSEVAAQRHLDPAQLRADIDALPDAIEAVNGDQATLALNQHLVDGLATREELRQLLASGDAASADGDFRRVDFSAYTDALPAKAGGPTVAVVVAEGEIAAGNLAPGKIGGDSTAALVRQAREDDSVKALVLRVNSPGGAVYPAEQIRREVELTRKAGKPVIVSMGDLAASGGYWISMNANTILAEPNTITGSIGIFGLFYEVPATLDKIGVHVDGVGTTPWAGAFDIRRPLDPRVGRVVQSVIDKGYRDFVGHVAAARGQPFDAIDKIARGRVWSGQQALERGLVDKLGGLTDAIKLAATAAKLGDNYQVVYQERALGTFERLLMDFGRGSGGAMLRAVGFRLPSWWLTLQQSAPELSLLTNLKPGMPNAYAYCFCRVE